MKFPKWWKGWYVPFIIFILVTPISMLESRFFNISFEHFFTLSLAEALMFFFGYIYGTSWRKNK